MFWLQFLENFQENFQELWKLLQDYESWAATAAGLIENSNN